LLDRRLVAQDTEKPLVDSLRRRRGRSDEETKQSGSEHALHHDVTPDA
jgi:hypothetical protein